MHVNQTALWIGIVYGVACLAGLVVFWWVWRSTRPGHAGTVDPETLKHRETTWFWFVGVGLFALLAATILDTPWRASAKADRQVVHVTGVQFGWTLKPPGPYVANRQIEFHLTSVDVNHGFGLYDPDGAFVAQAQVIPDHDLLLRLTLHKPGRYTIRCFEYCGLDHHQMIGSFQVRSAP